MATFTLPKNSTITGKARHHAAATNGKIKKDATCELCDAFHSFVVKRGRSVGGFVVVFMEPREDREGGNALRIN